jgi:class I fructose-bisphosphate aldolase
MGSSTGKAIRLGRVLDPADGRASVVALDHGLHLGPVPGAVDVSATLNAMTRAGADAFLVSPGLAQAFPSVFVGKGAPGLILRVDWTNRWRAPDQLGSDEGRGRMIARAEDAARLGADAVLAYVFLGYEDPDAEARQVEDVAHLVWDCDRLGIGCILEPMPRGRRADHDPYRAEHIALAARIACELGADVLKTDYSGDADSFRQVTAASFRPVLIAGGPRVSTDREFLTMVAGALAAGAQGVFIGRNLFQAPDPESLMRAVRTMVHEGLGVDGALAQLGS